MKEILFLLFAWLLFCCTCNAEMPGDSTRTKRGASETKEREKKNGSDDTGILNYEKKESFFDHCFSSFATSLLVEAFTSDDEDSFIEDDSLAAAKASDDNLPPSQVRKPAAFPDYRIYLGFGAGFIRIGGKTAEEYPLTSYIYSITNAAYVYGFTIDLGFSYSSVTGEPKYNYITTFQNGSDITTIKDIPSSISYLSTAFSIGASYMLDFSPYVGMKFGGGGMYRRIKEETEIFHEKYFNNELMISEGRKDILDFSGFYPYINTGLYFYLDKGIDSLIEILFQYNFINRDPQFTKSTSMDWNRLKSGIILGLNLQINLLQ